MNITPQPRKLGEIFKQKYEIDFYQREYKWNDNLEHKPVKSLLDDIFYRFELEYKPNLNNNPKNIGSYEWYYLNTYLTNEAAGSVFIVDGQQRLTTLTLIIIKMMHMAREFNAPNSVIQLFSNAVCGTGTYGQTYWLGFEDRVDALTDLFTSGTKTHANQENISEKNIYENYEVISNYLDGKLNNQHKFEAFYMYFFERIQLVEIKIEKPKDVAMVFEVINDRGIPLSAYEILKGKLLGTIDKQDVDIYIPIWDEAIKTIQEYNDEEVDEFFSTYFRSKYADSNDQYRKLEPDKYHRTVFVDDFDLKIELRHNEQNVKHFVTNIVPYYLNIPLQ